MQRAFLLSSVLDDSRSDLVSNNLDDAVSIPCVPKKVLRLINNRTKAFSFTSEMFFGLLKRDPNLDFDILFFSFE